MEPDTRTYDGWIGRDAYDADGDKIGEITDIYYDDETGRPEWVAVKTGLFGTKHSFVPIHGSSVYREGETKAGTCRSPSTRTWSKALLASMTTSTWIPTRSVSCGPTTATTTPTTPPGKDFGYGKAYAGPRADKDYEWRKEHGAIGDVGAREDEAVTRSEEELRVDKASASRPARSVCASTS